MKVELLRAIRTVLKRDGVLSEVEVCLLVPHLHRRTVGRGIAAYRRMWEKTEQTLTKGHPSDGG